MTVFIAHAEPDQAVAEQLQTFLERRGLFVERESGQMVGRPLQHGDTLVALWSKASPFSPFRLQFEKRALDAWADGRLIFVKLDHQFAPVGLRDLPFVEASFEVQRDLVAWAEVAKRAQEVRRGPPPGEALDGAVGGAPPSASAPSPREAPRPSPAPARKKGGAARVGLALIVLAGVAAVFAAPYLGLGELAARSGLDAAFIPIAAAIIAAVLVGLLVLVVLAVARPKAGGARKKAAKQAEWKEEEHTDYEAPRSEAAQPNAPAVFVSYARADAPKVIPVCDALKKDGKELWIDQEGIGAGDSWAGEIVRAIRTVRGVAVMCSKAAFESDHVKREVYLADRYKKRLLPVFIEETPMPDDFEYFFAGVQQLKLHEVAEAERPALMARALAAV
ncbi:MAG: toll/interleukin-1 receptor domain-containing protein [Hyphomonadaceae bacterium]|nr:toll/interleukin-1 receptor domain-containing protein [Hyphomonadaceae bacterium]